ncbi:hypothetical protein scyTo_0025130, partial [Scyliorhinus torazame]|nr:hypothetical protein [Scyliorhinus torazame]
MRHAAPDKDGICPLLTIHCFNPGTQPHFQEFCAGAEWHWQFAKESGYYFARHRSETTAGIAAE